ncbi:hypothetical protein AHAS_Ahas20G0115700 [Arachis hypogaea]
MKEGVIAVVVRDFNRTLITGTIEGIKALSSLSAEAYAIRSASILAKNFQIENIINESYSLTLIQALKLKRSIGEVESVLHDIGRLAKLISTCVSPNELAYQVARKYLDNFLEDNWSWRLIGDIRQLADKDATEARRR